MRLPCLWLWTQAQDLLEHELRQIRDEGKYLPGDLERRLRQLAKKGDEYLATPQGQAEAAALLDETAALPLREGYEFVEPSDLEGICAQRPAPVTLPVVQVDAASLEEKIYGAWLGRVYGCYLGKPVEGLCRLPNETYLLENFLKQTGQWPLRGYFSLDYPEEVLSSYGLNGYLERCPWWKSGPRFMPEDDDINYTIVAFAVMEEKGPGFAPEDIATFWLANLPIFHLCTAERLAYKNLCLNIEPPASASHRNAYREWVGAQIRGDFFGYAAPGRPELAARYAWRDACISHVKNGLYSEMWVAAMLASAYATSDLKTIVHAGLAQVPANSRFAQAINQVLACRASGRKYEEVLASLRARWDENNSYDWCHAIPNAQICAAALLWGQGDYAASISQAVLAGFDTDSNGATVGSVVGMIQGAKGLPSALVGRLNDRLCTGVLGYQECSIKEIAKRMTKLVERINVGS